jgi:hypothetical protein
MLWMIELDHMHVPGVEYKPFRFMSFEFGFEL